MSAEIALTFAILAVTIALLIWDRVRPELVALLMVLALMAGGLLGLPEALAGFSDATVIMIAALYVVGEGLSRTGVTAWLGQILLQLAGSKPLRLLAVLMAGTAVLSAFISNTGTVASLMPAVTAAAWSVGSLPSQYLMPLAFAANAGGLLTLTGTPPNIVIANTLADAGLQPFGYFEYGLIGLPLLAAAVAYMVLLGRRLLPMRQVGQAPLDLAAAVGEMAEDYVLPDTLSRLRVRRGSELVGKTLAEAALGRDYGVSVVRVERQAAEGEEPAGAGGGAGPGSEPGAEGRGPGSRRRQLSLLQEGAKVPGAETVIRADDVLLVKADARAVEAIMRQYNVAVQPLEVEDAQLAGMLLSHEAGLAEVLLTPRSAYIGKTIREGNFARKFNVQVLSLRRRGRPMEGLDARLDFGDSLLIRGTWEAISTLRDESRNFVVVGSPEAMARQIIAPSRRAITAVFALLAMIVLIVSGAVHASIAALIAALIMLLGGCLDTQDAYRAINWGSLILIAAMIPMSTALQGTGAAELISAGLVEGLGRLDARLLMAGVFLLTTAFSQVISNTAATVLLAPIVLQAALGLGVSPYPLLMAVATGASAAFLTPIGTSTNLMVTAPGGYGFGDFLRAGLPLVAIFLVVTVLLAPIIWPL
jgi:di/tricarboxylate transporter